MSFFSKLVKAGIDVVSLPVAVVKDVATLGGSITGHGSAVVKKLKEVEQDIEEAKEEL